MSKPVSSQSGSGDSPGAGSRTAIGIAASGPISMPASFSFDCYGIPFAAAVEEIGGAHGARLTVRGRLGTVPYSAECRTTREYMHAIVDAGRELPFADLALTSDQAVIARGSMDFPELPSPASVAAGTSVIVVALKPVVELMAACRAISNAHRLRFT